MFGNFKLLQVVADPLFVMTLEARLVGVNRGGLENLDLLESVQRQPFRAHQLLEV